MIKDLDLYFALNVESAFVSYDFQGKLLASFMVEHLDNTTERAFAKLGEDLETIRNVLIFIEICIIKLLVFEV